MRRAVTRPLNECMHCFGRAGNHRFDAAIMPVSYPACDVQFVCRTTHEMAEADALDAPGNDRMLDDGHGWDECRWFDAASRLECRHMYFSFNIWKISMSRVFTVLACTLLLFFVNLLPVSAAHAQTRGDARHRVIFQVSDNDPAKWNLALNNVRNVQQDLGKDNVEIELVAYGPGLPMLKLDSALSARISDALAQGVKIMACENTMTNTKVVREDMLPNIGYVKAGVVELMLKQQQGWAYIRP
jgi:uncharacterized protein